MNFFVFFKKNRKNSANIVRGRISPTFWKPKLSWKVKHLHLVEPGGITGRVTKDIPVPVWKKVKNHIKKKYVVVYNVGMTLQWSNTQYIKQFIAYAAGVLTAFYQIFKDKIASWQTFCPPSWFQQSKSCVTIIKKISQWCLALVHV